MVKKSKEIKGHVHSGSVLLGIFAGALLVFSFQWWERSARARAARSRAFPERRLRFRRY